MTSTEIVHAEIKRFLASSSPEILCVTGKWGVGKTYTWKTFLLEAQSKGLISLRRYSYVSLFGLNSLAELKDAIVEETVPVGMIGKSDQADEFFTWLKGAIKKLPTYISYLNKVPDLIDRFYFLLIREQLICIDDLERAGDGLSGKDVLGLASFLKEERRCKVVFLLNTEKLAGDEKDDFNRLTEKVFDSKLEFSPSPKEAADIGVSKKTPITELLSKNVVALGITNIRVIRKLERLALRFHELLSGKRAEVLNQAIHSATLFGWVLYEPDTAPASSFLSSYNPFLRYLDKKKEQTEDEKKWSALLESYGFSNMDEFDKVIENTVNSGGFNETDILREANVVEGKYKFQELDSSFSDAWRMYHYDFSATADEVLDAMDKSFVAGVKTISPGNMASTIGLFKELGRPDRAKELISYYIEQRKEEGPKLFDLSQSVFASDVQDPDIRTAFEAVLDKTKPVGNPKETLLRIARKSGWNPEDITLLASMTSDEFITMIKATRDGDAGILIKTALDFARIGGASAEMLTIAQTATAALQKMGAESKINARRARSYGIELPDKQ